MGERCSGFFGDVLGHSLCQPQHQLDMIHNTTACNSIKPSLRLLKRLLRTWFLRGILVDMAKLQQIEAEASEDLARPLT